MTVDLLINGKKTAGKSFVFSGGEVQFEFPPFSPLNLDGKEFDLSLICRVQNSDEVMQLVLAKEIIDRRCPKAFKQLVIPYFPYARQDRVMQPNEAFSLKAFANIINSLKFDDIITYDTHSNVTDALVNNLRVVQQHEIIVRFLGIQEWVNENQPIIIAPDAGAVKKAEKVAEYLKRPLVTATKHRNVTNGKLSFGGISDTHLIDGKNILIVDDICDGGGTFVLLADYLRKNFGRGVDKIALYVTHGIFSKGYDCFEGLIDRLYSTNTFLPERLPLADETPLFIHKIDEG